MADFHQYRLDILRKAVRQNSEGQSPLGTTDWYYRNIVPKNLRENIEFRKHVLDIGYGSEEAARELWMICSRDPLFYINTFAWTLDPLRHADSALRPFVTFDFQDKTIRGIVDAIGKRDVILPKTRDMGSSWMCLLALEWRFHFFGRQSFLLASQKEELVDSKSEKSLFRKLDLIWDNLPCWLRPAMTRTSMACRNEDNGSVFTGEATVERLATGDRVTAMLLDEAAHMPKAAEILKSTRDTTKTRILNSTPNGTAGCGKAFFEQCKNEHQLRIFMHWTLHPVKREGLYKIINGERVDLDPAKYRWEDDYDFTQMRFKPGEKHRPRSDWYDNECKRETNTANAAQELDLDFLGSVAKFVDLEAIAAARDECKPAIHIGKFHVDPETATGKWETSIGGDLELWCPLEDKIVTQEHSRDQVKIKVPPKASYVVGVDISMGVATQESSESSIVVWNSDTREQVALLTSTSTPPERWAIVAIAICRWFHNAYLIPEANGPGGRFIREVISRNYSNIHRRKVAMVISQQITEKAGYANQDGGEEILGLLSRAISYKVAKVNAVKILDQMTEYDIVNGKVVHTRSQSGTSDSDKGKAHGDSAIGCAVGWFAVEELPKQGKGGVKTSSKPKFGTLEWALQGGGREYDGEKNWEESYDLVSF